MKETTRRKFLSLSCRHAALGLGVMPLLSMILGGCKTMDTLNQVTQDILKTGSTYLDSRTKSVITTAQTVEKSFENFTPEHEYYIGRTIGAVILNKYPAYNHAEANAYINLLGQTLARSSDLPETFGGYRFLIQNSQEINAFAAPGGLIFITRGMLKCCNHEDALAAVLAHEIGHVQARHGLRAIKQSRITQAFTTIGVQSGKHFGDDQLSRLTQTFGDSIADITDTMITNGYSRSSEKEADLAAVEILKRVGYNPNGLIDMLNVMQTRLTPDGTDFSKTHPSPEYRARAIEKSIGTYQKINPPAARLNRFSKTIGII